MLLEFRRAEFEVVTGDRRILFKIKIVHEDVERAGYATGRFRHLWCTRVYLLVY